ncbi:MAG TPA: alkyl sulfatase dimerization domain-containing protein, partial [Opitutales bacterium]|nr:alkyl sulfatase dimerization domain-containing protein [Opitutales bacterium]
LPDSLGQKWYERGYYGTVNHDAKAVYQRYLGWYDGNPANLYPLPEPEAAKKYVELMGGANVILPKAQAAFDAGEYRWVAELLKQVVFADPSNQKARNLQADAFEQLGYQMENPTWRNEFLMGAYELRNGVPHALKSGSSSLDMIEAMSPELLLDYMGIRLNGPAAADKHSTIIWQLPNSSTSYALELRNGVLIYTKDKPIKNPDAVLTADKDSFAALLMGSNELQTQLDNHRLKITGNEAKVKELYALLVHFDPMFNIITPQGNLTPPAGY